MPKLKGAIKVRIRMNSGSFLQGLTLALACFLAPCACVGQVNLYAGLGGARENTTAYFPNWASNILNSKWKFGSCSLLFKVQFISRCLFPIFHQVPVSF